MGLIDENWCLGKLEIIAKAAIAKIQEHAARHNKACIYLCPIVLTRREYFFTKRYLQKMFNMKNNSKLMCLYGVRILRSDKI